ncbi:hypothetical protein A0H81_13208 [Grifola frondosa]|uniref:Uncharacterized protein n=1 Tax=Grifola frondosa TaxID=5627 RepID=A0A1C7LPL8_GRIFR|nr:hypothetical protein A0H81_13208 [Grifola frondosa]
MTDNDSSDPNSLSAQFSSQMSEYSRTFIEDDYLKGLSQFGIGLYKMLQQLGAEIGDLRIEFAESLDNVKRSLAKIKAEARDWRNLQGKSSGGEVDILRDKVTKLEFDTTVLKTQHEFTLRENLLSELYHAAASLRLQIGDEDVAELNSLQGALVLHRSGKIYGS